MYMKYKNETKKKTRQTHNYSWRHQNSFSNRYNKYTANGKKIQNLNNTTNRIDQLIFKENFTHQQQNTHSSQVYMKHSPREDKFWVIKQTSRNCSKN